MSDEPDELLGGAIALMGATAVLMIHHGILFGLNTLGLPTGIVGQFLGWVVAISLVMAGGWAAEHEEDTSEFDFEEQPTE